jgi:hypothetical protein
MYHPLAIDQLRVQQDELRRRAELARWSQETNAPPRRRQRWPLPRRLARPLRRPLTVRWATTARPCPDC